LGIGNVHILGGGLAGMSCAADLARKGTKVRVIEAQPQVGGLAQSFAVDGYVCDLGPHRFHSTLQQITDHAQDALAGNVHLRERMSRIYLYKRFFYYPLRAGNVIRNLPPWVLVVAFLDYWAMWFRQRIKPLPDDNFENYIRKRFGTTLYKIFFGTYTEKAWQIPPSQISADWASQRITLLNLWDTVKKTLFRPKDVPRTYVSKFIYPREGGVGQIALGYRRILEQHGGSVVADAPIRKLRIAGSKVAAVVYEKDGQLVDEPVARVVSTIPINRLVEMLDPPAPPAILQAARDLKHKAILFVYLMLDREQVTPDHWVYLPEKHLAVHRISEFKNFSDRMCPPGRTLVCAEITCNEGDARWKSSDAELAALATADLEKVGLIRKEQVLGSTVRRVPYAYPVYDLTYRQNLQTLLGHLRKLTNLISTGRQGLFRYGNMDHSIAMGARVARTISTGDGPDHGEVAAGPESID
jgi:protoporphyrinogen oxidase